MAITGSGSLAISLSLWVISAAFLLKGKLLFPSARLLRVRVCVCDAQFTTSNPLLGERNKRGAPRREKLWCGLGLRARCAQATESQHHFLSLSCTVYAACRAPEMCVLLHVVAWNCLDHFARDCGDCGVLF